MEVSYAKVYGTSHKFKLCKECGAVNWHDNDECVMCDSKEFNENGKGVIESLDESYKDYEDEGYNEDEIDEWELEV